MSRSRSNRQGRNDPCPCGSGKKFKRCHGAQPAAMPPVRPLPPEVFRAVEEHKARELQREQQQGLGRPIISTDFQGYKIVAVGSTVHWGKWKTFFDFLSDYIKSVLGTDWGNVEIAKPLNERHPIMQWYETVCHYQQRTISEPGKVHTAPMTGATAAYFGLAGVAFSNIPITVDGKIVGAVGVSGATSEQDAQVAKAGVEALI